MATTYDGDKVIIEKSVEANDHNIRIDLYLSKLYPYISRRQWQLRIAKESVLLNGKAIKHSKKVHKSDLVKYWFEKRDEPDVNKDYKVVYEDNYLLIINKPADLPIHPSGIYFANTLVSLLKNDLNNDSLSAVNRLDRETTGLVLISKSSQYFASLQHALKSSHKYYLVLVHGDYGFDLSQKGYIFHDTTSKVFKKQKFVYDKSEITGGVSGSVVDYKNCHTLIRKIKDYGKYSLLCAKLKTGRLHQIRATLHSLGFPLVGDKIYGLDETLFLNFIGSTLTDADRDTLVLDHSALHSYSLSFYHPFLRRQMKFKCPLPKSIQDLLLFK